MRPAKRKKVEKAGWRVGSAKELLGLSSDELTETHFNSLVDAYIAKSAAFAQPILKRLRELVHAASPDVDEAIKWGAPAFMHHGLLACMAAFKRHCVFGFWHKGMRAALQKLDAKDAAAGQFGRLTSVADLPSKAVFTRLVKQAMKLNESGVKSPRPARPKKRPPLKIPADFLAALGKNKKAHAAFTGFSYSHQKEYVEWIIEAKRDETRRKRIKTALEWLAEGKSRHWKYQRK
jgi:uncharacterized protein YdeI (YjbR/CyaY-like superfamily)